MTRARRGQYRVALGAILSILLMGLTACGTQGGDSGASVTSVPGDSSGENSIGNMNVGDVQFLDFGSGQGVDINFSSNSGEETYLAVLHSNNVQEGTFNVVLQGSSSANALAHDHSHLEMGGMPLDDESDENPMHELARAWGTAFANSPDVVPAESYDSPFAALTAGLKLGDTKSFRVLDSLSSVTSFTTVSGRLRYSSDDLLIYVDTEMDGSSDLTDAAIEDLARDFEGHALEVERDLFGEESDVNGDGTVTILMSPVLNRMCLPTGIVTGFFFPGDLYEINSANPASNEQEIFYTLVPDPAGKFCRSLGTEFTMKNILPGVLAHEFQHMVSFNQHVFLKGGPTEEPWLNEAASHLAEDLTGFGLENYSRVKLFLDRANSTSLIPSGLPSLSERGMGYLFLRYLYEQAGDPEAFTQALLGTNKTGVGNIEDALAEGAMAFTEFTDAFSHWQVALVLSGTGATNDSRYTYRERTVDPVTGNHRGICIHCDADDGRGTVLNGPVLTEVSSLPLTIDLESAGTKFFQISAPGSQLSISGSNGALLGGALIRLEQN